MHNTTDQSCVKDYSKEYSLGLDYRVAHKQCRAELLVSQLLLYCQDLCVRVLYYPFLDFPCLLKEIIELLTVCRKMMFQLLCLYICEL